MYITSLKKFLSAFCATCIFSFSAVCQQDSTNTIGRVTIASPTAASLGKYGDIPVGYHTGVPQVNIPIYTVTAGSLKLPIGLSYHASGVKVQDLASWVGTGWSLNAGGVITRTVVGAPDDRGYLTSLVQAGHYRDYGFSSIVGNPNNDLAQEQLYMTQGWVDGQPDLYFFNFGGYSGKFYFNDDRTPMFVPQQDFKVQPFIQSDTGFTGFIITTPVGVRYYFGKTGNSGTVDPLEITNPFTLQNGPANTTTAISSWFVNKIVSADGMDSITFSYQQENYSYYALTTSPVDGALYGTTDIHSGLQIGVNVVKNLVKGVRLSQISFPNGNIVFNKAASPRQDLSYSYGLQTPNAMTDALNTSSYALGSIRISDNTGYCKKDSFYMGYFYDNSALYGNFLTSFNMYNIHSDQYRLRLDSIKESTCDTTLKVPPYKFTYFGESLPRRLSFGFDHWGYPNGITNNGLLVPTYTQIVNNAAQITQGADREAYWPSMRGGSLAQINYPTGGYTNFEFEPKNSYAFNSSVFQEVPLITLVAHWYGQSAISQTLSFTTTGTGATTLSMANYSTAWSPTLIITNSSSVQVYNSGFLPTNATTNASVNLPAGTYSATLAFPVGYPNTDPGGATAAIKQFQNVPVTTTRLVGGLRIKTITTSDGITPTNIVTSYNYTGGGTQSTGVLYSIPTYVQIVRNDINKLVWGPVPGTCSTNGCAGCDGTAQMPVTAHAFYVSPGSVMPMATLQGENMGYNEVDVTQTGNGRSVYRYYGSNLWSVNVTDVCNRVITQSSLCDANIANYPAPPIPFEFMRDEMQYEGHFNEAGQLLKEVYYNPQYVNDPLKTPGHIGFAMTGLTSYTEYMLQTAKKIRDSVTTVALDPASGERVVSAKTTYYNSPYHRQPTRIVTSTSTGDSLATNTKYVFDFRVASCDAFPDSLSYFYGLAHNDTVWLNSNIDICTPQNNNSTNCRWAINGQFCTKLAQDRLKLISWRRRYFTDPNNLTQACYLTAKNAADTILKPILRLQDEYNNAPIEISEWKNTSLRHASFAKYDTSSSPVGFAYPSRLQVINLQSMSSTFTNSAVSGNTVTWDGRYTNESFYKFINGNSQQVTGHDGLTVSYIWDYSNKKPIAKVTNAAVDQIAYSSFEADGNGSWSIPSGTRDGTASITGIRSYNLSNGACTRSGLSSASSYIVSYWSKSGGSYTVTGSTAMKQGKTVGGWIYFEHTVTGVTSVTVSGTNDIDELRLYPSAAQMTTYTYAPLIGITSMCNIDNLITYYEYDGLMRLLRVRDMDKNIIKQYDYEYAVNVGVPYFNTQQRVLFFRQGCPCVYSGTGVYYTVPANTYSSYVSQAAANQLAINDVNANGQNYANAHALCLTTCTAASQKIINCQCETGTSVCTSSVYNATTQLYTITYHYQFSDGSISVDHTKSSSTPCVQQ